MTAPSFLQQHQLEQSFRDTVQRALVRLSGRPGEADAVDALVRAELPDLHRDLGDVYCERVAVDAAPPSAPVGVWLSPDQVGEAQTALWFARTHHIASLTEALQWYVNHRHGALDAPPIRRCVTEFLLAKRAEGLRPPTLKVHRMVLAKFAAAFGDRQPLAVSPREISAYLREIRGTSPTAVWTTLSTFFTWAVQLRYAFDNPVKLAQRRPQAPTPGRFIFTPAETRLLLRRAKFTPEIGFWAIALFAGLRVTEIKRIHHHPDPWSLLNLRTNQIEISRAVGKTRARLVPIRPVLRQWLKWIQFKHYPIYPPNQRDKCRWVRAIAAHRQENAPAFVPAGTAAGRDPRYYNIARRSYLSHRLALPLASYADVAREGGHNEIVLRRYYERRVTAREAREYFALTPSRV